ncbi:glycosyltransferase family 2 protein [Spirosoma rigui]|uniref:glycosyltransferase family 2 protein n=1 Tax=Spirosoma rigui TaxID=564064 RepID=UPI001474A6FD|nr:glycosyltransferase family 2 protein [Spirosoma rigui]
MEPIRKSYKFSIAGMVTLYNSERDILDNISTYHAQVDKLYLVDNSEVIDEILVNALRERFNKVVYIHNKGNRGIAYALNVAASRAVNDGFDYLLLMDDDSKATPDMINTMTDYIVANPKLQVGIIAAQSDPNLFSNQAEVTWYTITSGSLLSINAFKQCGPFLEELFIDAVDHEYCFRLIEAGYKIVNLNYLHLSHSIGELKYLSIFKKNVYKWASHTPVRNYYMLRNFLYVIKKYNKLIPFRTKALLFYGLTKVCLINSMLEKDTLLRIRYMTKAISDFRHHKLGKLDNILD